MSCTQGSQQWIFRDWLLQSCTGLRELVMLDGAVTR